MTNDRKENKAFRVLKKEYNEIEIPAQGKDRMKQMIEKAIEDNHRSSNQDNRNDSNSNNHSNKDSNKDNHKNNSSNNSNDSNSNENKDKDTVRSARKRFSQNRNLWRRAGIGIAAAIGVFVAIPNFSVQAAEAAHSIPFIGKLFQAVTFRDYHYESDRYEAKVEVPKIIAEDVEEQGTNPANHKLDSTVAEINFDIEQVTDQLIKEFQESVEKEEGHRSLDISHEVVTDDERYFTLKLSVFQAEASGSQTYQFYTIDKRTGEEIQIGDLFREDSGYKNRIDEAVKEEMRKKMKEDDSIFYWVDSEEGPEWDWKGITDTQNFYFDQEGNLVIVFDEYEVAPGYMGAQEFTLSKEVLWDILKE